MEKDLQYEMVQRMKKSEDDAIYEGYIAAFEFPLIIDGDWNPYIFELTQTSKEDFLAYPDDHKIPYILRYYFKKYPDDSFFYRAIDYRKKVLGWTPKR